MSSDGTDNPQQPPAEGTFPPPVPPVPQFPTAPGQYPTGPGQYAPGQYAPAGQPQPPWNQYPSAAGQPAQPSQQWGQHPPAPPTPPGKKGLGAGAVIGIIAGSLVLLIAIIAVIVFTLRPGTGGPTGGGESEETTSTPAGVVRGFLEALAASDAESALSFIDEVPSSSPFLTDAALEASNAIAPITDIEVIEPEDSDFSARVAATYSIGDLPVTAEFSVNEYAGEGVWTMTSGTADLEFGDRFAGLDITLNGIPLTSNSAEVFIGTYEVATTTANFIVQGETTVTVRQPFDYPSLSEMTATLSEEGVAIFRQTVQTAVAACLASTTLVAGCGLDLPETLDDGTRLIDGTLTRSLTAEGQATLANLQPQETYSDPLVVTGDFIGGVGVSAQVEKDGATGSGELLFAPSLGAPVVDFTSGTPTVRWD